MATTRALLNVPTVSCRHCKHAIEGAVGALIGVDQVEVDIDDKSVTVDYEADDVSLQTIESAVQDEGYEVAGHHIFG